MTHFMGGLGLSPGLDLSDVVPDYRNPAYMSPVSPEGVSLDPSPGSTPVSQFSWDQLNQIVQVGLKTWSDAEKNKLLTEMALRKKNNQPIYLPQPVVQQGLSSGEKMALGIGGVALIAALGFGLYYFIGKNKRK